MNSPIRFAQSIKEYSLEYEDYHHNGLRLNFEDELSNNKDMRNYTMFNETTNKVCLTGTSKEKTCQDRNTFWHKKAKGASMRLVPRDIIADGWKKNQRKSKERKNQNKRRFRVGPVETVKE